MMRGVMYKRSNLLLGTLLVLTAILMSVFGSGTPKVLANDIQPYTLVKATNYASAGYGGMRGIGTGTILLSGVSGTVSRALLYWHGPTNSTNSAVNATVSFAGQSVTGTNIGLSSDNCWDFTNSQAYRADVTSLVSGNGSYALANFTKASADINGVSLIVFYDDGDATNNRDIVIFDGNDSNEINIYDAPGWNVTLPGINYTAGTASIQLHISDGQSSATNYQDAEVDLNGVAITPAGQIFSGNSVPNGTSAAATDGGLWDIKSFDITKALTPGNNTISLTSGLNADCLSMVAAVIDLPVGAAPITLPPPTTPSTPSVKPLQSNPANVYIVQQPTPNHGTAPDSVVSYTIKLVNTGMGIAKNTTVTLPLNPAAVDVVDATFSDTSSWVTSVTTDTLVFKTGPLGSKGGTTTATIRLRIKADASAGDWLTDRASMRWSDASSGGTAMSNLPILTVAATKDDRPTYTLNTDTPEGAVGSTFTFSSGVFAPKEPVGIWWNLPDGSVETGDTLFAEDDGSLSVTFDSGELPAGFYSMVFNGHWTEFTAVAPFTIK